MAESKKKPNPVDVHVGARLRLRRTSVGMSQEKLGEHLGITFQQIQKYEKGTNRIGASRLQNISEVLSTPVSFFFDGMPGVVKSTGNFEEPQKDFVNNSQLAAETAQLVRAFQRIIEPRVRRRVVELVQVLGEALDGGPKNRRR